MMNDIKERVVVDCTRENGLYCVGQIMVAYYNRGLDGSILAKSYFVDFDNKELHPMLVSERQIISNIIGG